ncbi:hypothetical protein [Acetobacter nitrogenifigens]|uniref:hypothetical protein n=1 Tax=Acetobacter nitrogenifigens TaxID=285268 RepID=UPI0003F97740|nr:hypothetical protein [Acetobacter nitrogenifigens]
MRVSHSYREARPANWRRTIRVAFGAAILSVTAVTHAAPPSNSLPPNSAYPDGTGDSEVDGLNAAQIGGAYAGPYYRRDQPAPAARPVTPRGASSATATTAQPQGRPQAAGTAGVPETTSVKRGGVGYDGSLYYRGAGRPTLPPPSPR